MINRRVRRPLALVLVILGAALMLLATETRLGMILFVLGIVIEVVGLALESPRR